MGSSAAREARAFLEAFPRHAGSVRALSPRWIGAVRARPARERARPVRRARAQRTLRVPRRVRVPPRPVLSRPRSRAAGCECLRARARVARRIPRSRRHVLPRRGARFAQGDFAAAEQGYERTLATEGGSEYEREARYGRAGAHSGSNTTTSRSSASTTGCNVSRATPTRRNCTSSRARRSSRPGARARGSRGVRERAFRAVRATCAARGGVRGGGARRFRRRSAAFRAPRRARAERAVCGGGALAAWSVAAASGRRQSCRRGVDSTGGFRRRRELARARAARERRRERGTGDDRTRRAPAARAPISAMVPRSCAAMR